MLPNQQRQAITGHQIQELNTGTTSYTCVTFTCAKKISVKILQQSRLELKMNGVVHDVKKHQSILLITVKWTLL